MRYKTFYTVRYTDIGMFYVNTLWFDRKDEAIAFSMRDYADASVRHVLRNHESILEADRLVAGDRAEVERLLY